MQSTDLQAFEDAPFFFWAKDEEGRYIWANKALKSIADEDLVGKTDSELRWGSNATNLQAVDKEVLETGQAKFLYEYVGGITEEEKTFSVCKYPGNLNGKKCTFGISFMIDQG